MFQLLNPPTFNGAEGGPAAKGCLENMGRSVAPKWKEDKIAFWSAEEFWKLSNGKKSAEAIYSKRRPLK
ncbi:DNA gyrase subunit B [Dorcoceras hygrometricum]|uniref:DNA gyrase subunit B n=1 Tax=Dorcoceras hygrometricum TaxID=472368 RepID=A0A2Z7BT94_9LAMI|nr:DNA gyrase subunit B [Dorcoceras hygrometricum]